jgi:hypothetical protein
MMKFAEIRNIALHFVYIFWEIDQNFMKNVIFYTMDHFFQCEPDELFSKLPFYNMLGVP